MDGSWVNLDKYGLVPVIIFGAGCALWIVVYAIYVRNSIKYKFMEMPLVAACSNFAWEGAWGLGILGLGASTDMGKLFGWGYFAWLFIDAFLLYFVITYAVKHIFVESLKPYARQIAILFLVFFYFTYSFLFEEGFDTPIGGNSAYIAQVLLSALYINLIVHKKSIHDLSYAVAWLKMVATGLVSVFMFMTYFQGTNAANRFVLVGCVFALILDLIYIWIFNQRRAAEA